MRLRAAASAHGVIASSFTFINLTGLLVSEIDVGHDADLGSLKLLRNQLGSLSLIADLGHSFPVKDSSLRFRALTTEYAGR
jgi:hypothetical protein